MNFDGIGWTTMIRINPIFSWIDKNILIWKTRRISLPVFDWSWRSRHDWNGWSRWTPLGSSISFNWFERLSSIWSNCKPRGFDGRFSSNFSIERRNLLEDQSTLSDSWSNELSLLGKRVSPGGPWKIKEMALCSPVSHENIPVDQDDPTNKIK